MTDYELSLMLRLLHEDFPGRDELLSQLYSEKVMTVDEDGSIEFSIFGGLPAEVRNDIPVEGEALDVDGVGIHVLLHTADGFLVEMEIYKDDGTKILRKPDPTALELFIPLTSPPDLDGSEPQREP